MTIWYLAILLLSVFPDPFRDSKFQTPKWREPFLFGTDRWHYVKWTGFYPPRMLALYLIVRELPIVQAAIVVAVTGILAWIVWQAGLRVAGEDWPSTWRKWLNL